MEQLTAPAGPDRPRQRVPLPQPGPRPRHPGDRHHPVGRDRSTPWPRCGWPARPARPCWRSPTSWAARPPARPTPSCSRGPVSRSAWRPPRHSSPSSRRFCSHAAPRRGARHAARRRAARRPGSSSREVPALLEQLPLGQPPGREIARRYHDEAFFLYLGRHIGFRLPRGRAQAQGNLLHPHRGLCRRRDEARADRADRRVAGGGGRQRRTGLREVVSNIEEVRARGADVIAVASEGNDAIEELAAAVLRVPRATRWWPPCSRLCRCSCWPTTSPASAA